MPWKLERSGDSVLVVREDTGKVVGRHKSRKKALRQLAALYSIEKASFSSRSEAGQYAAEQRWKGHVSELDISELEVERDKTIEITKQLQDDGAFTSLETEIMDQWAHSGYLNVNRVLRDQWEKLEHIEPESTEMESLIMKANALVDGVAKVSRPLPENAIAFRGIREAGDLPPLEVGDVLVDSGFAATSLDYQIARDFGDGMKTDVVMRVIIPKGVKVWLPKTEFAQEKEIVLLPDTKMRVVKKRMLVDGGDPLLELTVEVVDG